MQKLNFEVITPIFGNSFKLETFDEYHVNHYKSWHYHPEIELVYINGGAGKRQIGSHMSYFNDGDLILIGKNLPHCGFTDRFTGNKKETLVQFKEDFLGSQFFEIPEMELIKNLFTLAEQGLAFHGETKARIGHAMENLGKLDDFKRLLSILDILHELSQSAEMQILNAEKFAISTEVSKQNRINKIFNYVKNNFHQPIPLETVSSLSGMTEPSFCRYFKKTTSKTFTQFVNEYRLVHASKLLAEKQMAISDIAFEAGFQNVSHFTRLFKQFTGMSPSAYRHEMKNIVST